MSHDDLTAKAEQLSIVLASLRDFQQTQDKRGFVKSYVYDFVSSQPDQHIIAYDLYCATCDVLARLNKLGQDGLV